MGYRIGTLAGDGLRKTYTHNNFAILKFSLTQGLKQILNQTHQTIWIMFGQAIPNKSGTWSSTNSHILTGD